MRYPIALGQMFVRPGEPNANLERAREQIAEAARRGARLVVLPELLDFGWTHPSARAGAGAIPGGRSFETLAAAAAAERLYVCAGIAERDGERLFNSAVLIGPDGRLLIKHRKINELDFARTLYALGDRINVHDTELGRIGLMVCADGFVSDLVIGRALGLLGAQLILSPGAWAVPPDFDHAATRYGDEWRRSYAPVAREFHTWVFGVSNVGPVIAGEWSGWRCIGNSLVFDRAGNEILCAPHGERAEALLVVDVEVSA